MFAAPQLASTRLPVFSPPCPLYLTPPKPRVPTWAVLAQMPVLRSHAQTAAQPAESAVFFAAVVDSPSFSFAASARGRRLLALPGAAPRGAKRCPRALRCGSSVPAVRQSLPRRRRGWLHIRRQSRLYGELQARIPRGPGEGGAGRAAGCTAGGPSGGPSPFSAVADSSRPPRRKRFG